MKVCLLLCLTIPFVPALSQASVADPVAISLTGAVQIAPGAMSQPLSLKLVDVGTSQPVPGVAVQYSTDSPNLVLMPHTGITDASGEAMISCMGVQPGSGHVVAMMPNGSLVVFQVTVAAPSGGPVFHTSEVGRVVWQGTSTLTSGHTFAATVTDGTGRALPGADVLVNVPVGDAQLINGAEAIVNQLALQAESDGSVAFNALFPETSAADDFSVISLTVQGVNNVFLIHALPRSGTPAIQLVSPSQGVSLPLAAGQPSSVPVQLKFLSASGSPLSGVSVDLPPSSNALASCAETLLLTGSDGTFSCHLQVSGQTGVGSLSFLFGGIAVSPTVSYTVSPGQVAIIHPMSGNLQKGFSGQVLPSAVTAQLLDADGNPVPNAAVTWQSNGVTIIQADQVSSSNGIISATVQMGSQAGASTLSAGVAGMSSNFSFTNTSSGQLSATAGDRQVANLNSAFETPLQVRVSDVAGKPLAGTPVSFNIVNGAASLSANSAVTDDNGVATVVAKSGEGAGFISIQAHAAGNTTGFLLTALPPAAQSVRLSDWNDHESPVIPGAVMTVSFVPATAFDYEPVALSSLPYPTILQGISVSIDGLACPILRIGGSGAEVQVQIQVPWEFAASRSATLLLRVQDSATRLSGLSVREVLPVMRAARVSRRMIMLKATGIGQFTPLASTNSAGIPGQEPKSRPSLFLDGKPCRVISLAADHTLPGMATLTIEPPRNITRGIHSLWIETGSVRGPVTEVEIR